VRVTLAEVRARMHELETSMEAADRENESYAAAARKFLGLEEVPLEEFERALAQENARSLAITREQCRRFGIRESPGSFSAVGLVQGITLAVAALQLIEEQPR